MAIVTQKLIKDIDSELFIYEFIENHFGVNLADSPDNLEDRESENDSNDVSDPIGAITKRPGYVKKNTSQPTSNNPWVGLKQARFTAGAEDIGISGATVYRISAAGALTDITNSLTLTNDDDNLMDSTLLRDMLVIFNRSRNGPFQITTGGLLTALGGTPPVGIGGFNFKRRVFTFGTAANPNLLYYSSNTNNESWDTANDFLNLDEDDGDILKAGTRFGNRSIVWKNRKTYEIIHTATIPAFIPEVLDENEGCPSQQGHIIINHPSKGQILYWLSESNIMEMVGRTPRPIGFKVQPEFSQLARTRFQYAQAFHIPRIYVIGWALSTGGSTTNEFIIIYNYLTGQFRFWKTGIKANCFSHRSVSNVKSTWFGDYSGDVNELDNGDADGEIQDQSFSSGTGDQNLGDVTSRRNIYQVFQSGQSDTLDRIQIDLKKSGSPTGKIIARLFSVASSKPNAQLEQSPTQVESSNLTTSYQTFDFIFSTTLVSGTSYAIVLTSPSEDASNFMLAQKSGSGGYSNGNSGNGPASAISDPDDWTELTGEDLNFTTFVGGTAIDGWRETAWIDAGIPNSLKLFRFMVLLFIPTGDWNLEVEYRTDFQTDWTTPNFPTGGLVNLLSGDTIGGTFTLGTSRLGTTDGKEAEIEIGEEAKRIQFRFRNQNANEKFIIAGFALVFEAVGFHIAA